MRISRLLLITAVSLSIAASAQAASHHVKSKAVQVVQSTSTQRVDVNAADATTIASVKGIGPKRAAAIVAYRQQHGNFKSIEDLTQVKGLGPKLLARVKNGLSVG